jgi:hypothetical protein
MPGDFYHLISTVSAIANMAARLLHEQTINHTLTTSHVGAAAQMVEPLVIGSARVARITAFIDDVDGLGAVPN